MVEIKVPPTNAFTAAYNGRTNEIVSDCGVSIPFVPAPNAKITQQIITKRALWDTGATNSVITEATAKELNLKPISKAEVTYGRKTHLENVYLVNIFLPNNVIIPNVRVTECEDTNGRFGLIIGMDIITLGDFAITNVENKTTVSFRLPSKQTIDYVKEVNAENSSKGVGRNDPCWCKSGKKFKCCHGEKN